MDTYTFETSRKLLIREMYLFGEGGMNKVLHFTFGGSTVITNFFSIVDDLLVTNPLQVTLSPQQVLNGNCVSVEANDDTILENEESFVFSITFSDSAIMQIVPNNGEIIIQDNDSKFLGYVRPD